MRTKILTLFAALLLLGACGTTPEEQASTESESASTTTEATTTDSISTEPVPGPAPGSQEDLTVNVGDRIFFGFDSSELDMEAQATIERLAIWLNSNPSATLTIEGHCDERGTTEYNLALGDRRATAVRDFLIALGISPGRLSTISYGEERPAVNGQGESIWAQNRRGVFAVN